MINLLHVSILTTFTWVTHLIDRVEVSVVDEQDRVVPEHSKAIPKHKKNLDIGNKTTTYASTIYLEQDDVQSFAPNEEVTLMDWGNAYMLKDGTALAPILSLNVKLHLEGDFKKTSKKVHWLAKSESAPLVDVVLKDYDYLITKKKIEEDDDWTDFINPVSEFREDALADANVKHVKAGDIIQFERKGFYICDKDLAGSSSGKMEFILIPDGKASSIALKAKITPDQKPVKDSAHIVANGQSPVATGLPEKAPSTAQPATVDSRGMPIPVTTKVRWIDAENFILI